MKKFKSYYTTSCWILKVMAVLSLFGLLTSGQFNITPMLIMLALVGVTGLPLWRGFEKNRKPAILISAFLTIIFGWISCSSFIYFVETGGGEGPNGEGAPGAFIIAMVFFALLFVCPWLLTALRGMRLWKIDPGV